MKNRRSSSEYLEAPQLSEEINGVKELLYQEAKDKKAQLKKNDKDISEVVMAVPEEGEVEEDEDDPIKTTFGHMVIGETEKPELPFKKNAEGTEMAKLNDKLLNLKKIAQRKVWLCQKCHMNCTPLFIFLLGSSQRTSVNES